MRKNIPCRNHLLLAAGLGFFAGCRLAGWSLPGLWPWLLVGLGLLLAVLSRPGGHSLLVPVVLCCCGLGLLRTMPLLYPSTPAVGSYEQITGYVCGEPELRSDNRLTFTLTEIRLDGQPVSGRAYCSFPCGDEQPPQLFDGASLSLRGRVYVPAGKEGAPRFDFRTWLLQNRMTFGIAASGEMQVHNTPQTAPVKDWAGRLLAAFRGALQRTMGDGADLAMALLFSDKAGVEEGQRAAFERLGIAHILSVSGLHVCIVGSALCRLLGWLRLRRGRWPVVAVFLFFYCMLTGFSAASVRAAAMLLASYGAYALGRPREPLNNLGLALLVVLAAMPSHAFSAGLVLSVSAVLGICLLRPVLAEATLHRLPAPTNSRELYGGLSRQALGRRLYRFAYRLGDGFLFSLSAQLGVLLPTAYYFQQLPVYGVFINTVLVPYVGLLVPVQLLALVLSPLPLLGPAAGRIAAAMGNLLLEGVALLNRLPMAAVRVSRVDVLWLAIAVLVLVALSGAVRTGAWKRLVAPVAAAAVAAVVLALNMPPATRYVQLSVGRADAALLFDREATIAIDAGADGEATLAYLADAGRDIDALYLTHLHVDHTGGVPYLLENGIRIRRVYLPPAAELQRLDEQALAVLACIRQAGIPVLEMDAGDVHHYPTVAIGCLWPRSESIRTGQNANDLPLVLHIQMGGYTILNTADLTGSYEGYVAVPCDVLKVAHHGSDESTGNAFLQAADPQLAILSCGAGSDYLPGAATLHRLAAHDIPCLRTDASGDITLYVKNNQLVVAPYKEEP